MAVTVTTIVPPCNLAPKLKMAVYQCLLDSAHVTGGEAIDLTGDFDYIYAAWAGGNDTAADNYTVKLDVVVPAPATAVTASNVLITACWSADGTDGEAFVENTGDLSAIGQLSIVVIGA